MPKPSGASPRLLKFLAVLFGLALVGALEGVLHLFNLGPSSRLFLPTEKDGAAAYAINPQAAHRFFQPKYLRHVPFDAGFAAEKPPGTVRVFALGASTLVGFPNPPSTAFTHFLERMLADAYPDRRFEVVNCGITAINSFCLLDFAEEILQYQPDLLIVYAGHNEFVGPYGPTTPFVSFGGNRRLVRMLMALQRSRIYGIVRQAWNLRGQGSDGGEDGRFGLHLATEEIDILDEDYRRAGDNYRRNLEAIVRGAAAQQVPVLLSTLVSNLKDFYPLRSTCPQPEPMPIEGLRAGLGRWPYCAALHFELGQRYMRQGEAEQAHQAFVRARDMDRLPFRAPTYFNQIVRQLAKGQEVMLSDSEAVFAAASPQGIIGSELITEHLHPTVYGHYLIARNMVEVLDGVALGWGRSDLDWLGTYEVYAEALGYTLEQAVDHRNSVMLFLKQMPYEKVPATLRRQIAALLEQQLADIPRLTPAALAAFRAKGGGRFLHKMMDFLLPADRTRLAGRLEAVLPRI